MNKWQTQNPELLLGFQTSFIQNIWVFFFVNMIDCGFGFSSAISDETHPRKKKRDIVALSQFTLHCYSLHSEESTSFSEKYFVFLVSVNILDQNNITFKRMAIGVSTYHHISLTDTSVIQLSWIWQMPAI